MLLPAPHRLQTPPRTVLKRFVISLHISILWKCPRDHKVFLPSVPTHPAVSNLVAIQMIFAALCRRAGSLLAGPVAAGSPALVCSCS